MCANRQVDLQTCWEAGSQEALAARSDQRGTTLIRLQMKQAFVICCTVSARLLFTDGRPRPVTNNDLEAG